jgi:uncharacterized protein (TIGR00369 family)
LTSADTEGKPVRLSRITLNQLMQPQHANLQGNVHGGWIMKLADEAGALAAMRHAQCNVVTVAIDQMNFHEPIRIGDVVQLDAQVTYVGRTSIETRVQVIAENPVTGEQTHTNTAYLVYVALDEKGNPKPVSPIIAETELESKRLEAGKARQLHRRRQLEDETD